MAHEHFVLCDALAADGSRCPVRHQIGTTLGYQQGLPSGWSEVTMIVALPHVERPPMPNPFRDGPLKGFVDAVREMATKPDPEDSEIVAALVEAQRVAGDIASSQIREPLTNAITKALTIAQQGDRSLVRVNQMVGMFEDMFDPAKIYPDEWVEVGGGHERTTSRRLIICDQHAMPAVRPMEPDEHDHICGGLQIAPAMSRL
jgi:hypothetical protein